MEGAHSHRRLSLLEQKSAVDKSRNTLTGLTLDAVLSGTGTGMGTKQQRHHHHSHHQSRALLDIIRDEAPHKDKKSWKNFRDKFRLKRAGAAWMSTIHTPTSDISIPNNRSQLKRRSSFNRPEESLEPIPISDPPAPTSRPQLTYRSSTRFGISLSVHDDHADIGIACDGSPRRSFRPQISRHNSTRFPGSNEGDDSSSERRRLGEALTEMRVMSAREAVVAQEAAEAEAAATEKEEEEAEPVRTSLMDLLEENDREMGLTGSRYAMGDIDEEEEEEYYDDAVEEDSGGIEYTCCVCMVRHKSAAFIPCGHTFCRLCSRELWVQRGNCLLCNGFILEILDIF
ncbi:hypothetical protein SLE2022_210130 [Rubroshorea leprosula]